MIRRQTMVTRKSFLASGAALAVGAALGEGGKSNGCGLAKALPDVKYKDLQTVKMLSGGGQVYALSSRMDHISLSTVFVSPEGNILVVDGGFLRFGGGDGKFLGEFLRKLGGHVDYWFLTHAHEDHYGALVTMCERPDFYGVTIGELIFNFPDRKWMEENEPESKPYLERFYGEVLGSRLKNVKRGDCSPGRVVNFGSWSFEILNEPFLIKKNQINNSSVMISVRAGGKTWLETGDLGIAGGQDALKKIGPRLKHDIVFLAHHGQNGVDKDFYAAVAPEAAIWPTPSWLWENRAGKGTCGSGPWRTNYVKCWMQDLGVKKNYVLTKDYLFV
ncbi:MAG: MBL fold metallo-hydrolase [Kiritimatiellae bacterium]|nr:MBL fold metallo-hydrolase [Kiritimatiellia bacterium]